MTSRSIKTWFATGALCTLFLFIAGCKRSRIAKAFKHRAMGYYYRLLSFQADSVCYYPEHIAQVSAVFKTQADSTFWDSRNNLNGNFFIAIDSSAKNNFLRSEVSIACVSDSIDLLVKPKDFFLQQFASDSIPFFSKNDSAVKISFKIDRLYSQAEFDALCINLKQAEAVEINRYFGSPASSNKALDPQGFYWIEKPEAENKAVIEPGDMVSLSYRASFINGRFLEKSGVNFDFIYGTPDQLLKGVNYVIGALKLGQTAKILLPSRLAFGESGSSNGTVPPYTPLIYEVKIIDVKKIK